MLTLKPPTATQDSPLFTLPHSEVPVTISYLTGALHILLEALHISPQPYSLHSLRRSGATEAYKAGVGYAQIKSHGTWRSDSFWTYISTTTLSTQVPEALAATFINN
jgi:hypothetical protein